MPEVDLDFGSVGKMPEDGTYRLHVDAAIFKKNKDKDGFVANLQMSLTDMPDNTFDGMKVFDSPSFKLSARWKLKEVLDAVTQQDWDEDAMKLEWVCEDDCDAETFDECPHKKHIPILEDTDVLGICYADDYQGRLSMKVRTYLPDNGVIAIGPSEAA